MTKCMCACACACVCVNMCMSTNEKENKKLCANQCKIRQYKKKEENYQTSWIFEWIQIFGIGSMSPIDLTSF